MLVLNGMDLNQSARTPCRVSAVQPSWIHRTDCRQWEFLRVGRQAASNKCIRAFSQEHVAIYVAKVEQFWFREDKPGVIFLMDTESLDQAKSKIHDLPLAANGFLGFEFIPIGPLYVQVDCSTLHRM